MRVPLGQNFVELVVTDLLLSISEVGVVEKTRVFRIRGAGQCSLLFWTAILVTRDLRGHLGHFQQLAELGERARLLQEEVERIYILRRFAFHLSVAVFFIMFLCRLHFDLDEVSILQPLTLSLQLHWT